MANIKKNKVIARSIVAAGTLLAGIGIWASVTNAPQPYSASISSPIVSIEPDNRNSVENQPETQTGSVSVPQPSLTQPSQIQPTPTTTPAGVVPPQSVPIQPAPTMTPAPTPNQPTTRLSPRFRTRGS